MRLDKFLAHNGYGTRKDVKILVKKKKVSVNDFVIRDAGYILDLDHDVVRVEGLEIHYVKDIYLMMNKPANYICEHDPVDYPSALELIQEYHNDLFFVGRLDVDTEGLLIITNDGLFSHNIAHGKKDVHKQYYVQLAKPFDVSFISKLNEGIILDDDLLKPAQVEVLEANVILLTIAEGKYHQVKRMMHFCDNEVTYLKRIKIGDLELDPHLEVGSYRSLSPSEIALFQS